ncbi:lutropin-choriogonadotropic hormone receptor-like [Spodoptera litura]|uniref:Lutropin-choriogonadotropic hormone receptor-like n=1 Tax=Spodoptera litura TaxID=69820 RepID=A0A9J7IQF7_SPOLT|nr:lutropin-choriogonadotropic hormone receptor-like [Spodoptera litura]
MSDVEGDVIEYLSVDNVVDTEQVTSYPTEFLNSLELSGVPSHKLRLKGGVPVMLLHPMLVAGRQDGGARRRSAGRAVALSRPYVTTLRQYAARPRSEITCPTSAVTHDVSDIGLDHCACGEGGARLDCRSAALRRLPPLHENLLSLDVSNNNISTLPRDALLPAAGLRELNLSSNRLESVSAGALGGAALARLWLDRCALRRLPGHALRDLHHLHFLSAEDNYIAELEAGALWGCRALRSLRLARNLLRALPTHALAPLRHLQTLNLAGNLITELSDTALPPLPALHTLVLKRNRIAYIEEHAFTNTPGLRVLRLEENLLSEVPAALRLLPLLEDLSLASNRVEEVAPGVLQACRRLARLDLRANPLPRLHARALDHLPHLTTLVVSEARALQALPTLNGTSRLRTLRLDRARLTELPAALCTHAPQLRSLDLKLNMLRRVPELQGCGELRVLDLSGNEISALDGGSLRGLRRLHDLLLARNRLRRVPADAFTHTPDLQVLNLEDNMIDHIDMEAFVPVSKLEDLNVGNNQFSWLPGSGLQRLLHLKAHNNPNLRRFHPPDVLPRIQVRPAAAPAARARVRPDHRPARTTGPSSRSYDRTLVPLVRQDPRPARTAGPSSRLYGRTLAPLVPRDPRPARAAGPSPRSCGGTLSPLARLPGSRLICRCTGPFLPCVDLFDWWTLRCGVWAVFLLALLGNGTVVFVLVCSRSRIDVPRFLVTNLAAADFFMGIYLGFLAVVDAGTLGEFRAHAIAWQMSGGCKLAGFLGVLSSELSVFTLAVITLERNYAITHAMHLNKRLSLRHAAAVMAAGWAFSLTAATLPLLGVSDYRKFAVCLPFETSTPVALGYVVTLLVINGVAFLVLLGCYLKMYCAIRGSQAWNSNDSRIAKRMALLVFTDFLCWSPIAFFALTAAFGAQLVSLEEAKVFTVFVLPLNSCCNPFLYAILTKQFKKDCALVCKAIEESRVTRGIGRCRHSSNFSNRQTPANTNSLAERSSRGQHGATCACRRLLPGAERARAPPAVSGDEPPSSPPALAPRLLHTIPSAAEAELQPDEETRSSQD